MTEGTPAAGSRAADRAPQGARLSNLQRTFRASGWMYSSRALVFVWALLLTHEFGIHSYGIYAMAFATGALIGVPIDSYFSIRAPRVSDEIFLRERATRAVVGFFLVAIGVIAWPFSFGAGFAGVKAGVDVCFQATRSGLIRDGHPDRAQRADALRQVTGIVLGCGYLLIFDNPSLPTAALLYLVGCALPIARGLRAIAEHRPVMPEFSGRSASILTEAVGGVAYVQAEVILLGLLGSPTSAGFYSFGATIVWSLAALGQSFGYTFHEGLRRTKGHVDSGPPLATAVMLSMATAGVMVIASVLLYAFDSNRILWLTFAWLAPVSFLRTLSSVSTVVLAMQHRDVFRMKVTAVSLAVKVGLIVVLRESGGPGAAMAFLVSDLIMSGAYTLAVYRRHGEPKAVTDG